MNRMKSSIIKFGVINKPKALEEYVTFVEPLGTNPFSYRQLVLCESYCVNPDCDCEVVYIEALRCNVAIQGPGIDPAKRDIPREGQLEFDSDAFNKPVPLEVTLPDGTVNFPKDYKADDSDTGILKQVRRGLTKKRLSVFRSHYKEARNYGNGNYWRHADWSHLKEGVCVPWQDVFFRAEPWIFRVEGKNSLADESYCINPSCGCREAVLHIYKIGSVFSVLSWRLAARAARFIGRKLRMPDVSASYVGLVDYNIDTGCMGIRREERGRTEQLLKLAAALFDTTDGLHSELRRRQVFMREFALHVAGQWQSGAEPLRTPITPGRNAPCPCGSGRKYKKCCMSREKTAGGA